MNVTWGQTTTGKGNNSFCRLRERTGGWDRYFIDVPFETPKRDVTRFTVSVYTTYPSPLLLSFCTDRLFRRMRGRDESEDHEAEGCQIPSSAHLMPFSSTPSFCLTIHSSLPSLFLKSPFSKTYILFNPLVSFAESIVHNSQQSCEYRTSGERKEREADSKEPVIVQ